MTFLAQVLAILWKDIRCELRSKQTWISMGLFALLVLVIFNFAFDLRVDNKAAIAPGALWVAFVFASLLGLGRTIASEQEKGQWIAYCFARWIAKLFTLQSYWGICYLSVW